jgi:hypothetical protein
MTTTTNKTLKEQLAEIDLLITYAAPDDRQHEARCLVRRYETDQLALRLLHHFYSYLPEAQEDAVTQIVLIESRQGIFLMLVSTSLPAEYLYLVNTEEAVFLGSLNEGLPDEEIRTFFGWRDEGAFHRAAAEFSSLPEYEPASQEENRCPVCSVAAGEFHIMGCPVEVCPWCSGQLTRCNCRFTLLNRERIDSDNHIDELYERATKAGRLPYDPQGQAPGYFSVEDQLKRKS